MATQTKTSNEVLNYTFDWTSETTTVSDTLASSSITVPTGLTLNSESNDTTSATGIISGGRHGVTYIVTNTVTTLTNGLTIDQEMTLYVNDYPVSVG